MAALYYYTRWRGTCQLSNKPQWAADNIRIKIVKSVLAFQILYCSQTIDVIHMLEGRAYSISVPVQVTSINMLSRFDWLLTDSENKCVFPIHPQVVPSSKSSCFTEKFQNSLEFVFSYQSTCFGFNWYMHDTRNCIYDSRKFLLQSSEKAPMDFALHSIDESTCISGIYSCF